MRSDFEYQPPTGQLPGVSFEQQTTAFFENVAAQADSASRAAADAQNTVAEAINAAQQAALAATQAQQAAQQAQNYAQGAQAAATAATQTADSAYTLADTAEADAQAAIGGALNLDLTISKSSGGSHTLTLAASPQYPSGIVRNGGEISASAVYDLWNGQVLSQAAINAIVAQYITMHP